MTTTSIGLAVRGMTCDSCARHVTRALQSVEGVVQADVPSWSAGSATVVMSPDVDPQTLIQAVQAAGYQASAAEQPQLAQRPIHVPSRATHDYDLIVIGSGGAGMGAAIKAAELGRTVCIVESGTIGGTCVNIGCVPSKTLISAAAIYHEAGQHPFAGLRTQADGVAWSALIQQKDQLVAELRQSKYVDVLGAYPDTVSVEYSRARLQGDATVVLDDGRTLSAAAVVIATGARPRIVPFDGVDRVSVLDSTSAMALAAQPKSLVVIGGRAVALEMGQMFARLGTQVTILQRSSRLIPEHEPELADLMAEYLSREGLAIHTGVRVLSVREEAGDKIVTARVGNTQHEFRAEQILMATGRTPNSGGLGLEELGVALDSQGFIQVDERMRTSHPAIFAAGDVTNCPQLVYVAAAAGAIAAENALTGSAQRLDLTVLPDVIFTDPQIATVGLTETQAHANGFSVKTTTLPLTHVPRAQVAHDPRGLIKLVAEQGSDRLLGAHILGAEAGNVIQTAALAVKAGLRYGFTVADLRSILFPYLTHVEGLKLAAQTFEKDISLLSCCAG